MKAIEIKKNIYWVGGIDWTLRNFHGYTTNRGSSYNAYLIIDEKITLIDTVKSYLWDEMLDRISSVVDPARIDNIIVNHVEMDHSGSLPKILELAPNASVVTSPAGEKGLREHFRENWNFKVVKNGESIPIGKRSLTFVHTPMIHWPDNMVTWCGEENLLFSNDSFGQHIASCERFDDELPLNICLSEAQKYYGNIVLCYNAQVQKALFEVGKLPVKMIAPSHGIIWRSHVADIVKAYQAWSSNKTEEFAMIIYDTMWHSTQLMAHAIADAFASLKIKFKIYDLSIDHISDVMTDVVTAKYICVGSPTMNNNLLPTVAGYLTYLRALSPKERIALAFGSYGWGGQSITQVDQALKECGFTMLDPIKVKYIPDSAMLSNIALDVVKKLGSKSSL